MSRRKAAEALAEEIREGAGCDIHGEVVWADDLVGLLVDALNAAAGPTTKALEGLLARPSDDPGDAIWVDERYDPAEPCDPPAVRYFMTPADLAEARARLALKEQA